MWFFPLSRSPLNSSCNVISPRVKISLSPFPQIRMRNQLICISTEIRFEPRAGGFWAAAVKLALNLSVDIITGSLSKEEETKKRQGDEQHHVKERLMDFKQGANKM